MSDQPYVPPPGPMPQPGGGKAIASLVLGIIGVFAWCIPCVGLPIAVIGLTLGIQGKDSDKRGLAIAGIILSSIGLAAALINAAIGAYLGATGQHPLLNDMQMQ